MRSGPRFLLLALLALIVPTVARLAAETAAAAPLPPALYADITTPHGTLTAELFADRAPLTVTNFVGLAEGTLGPTPGQPFFDGLTFHRVVPGFVVQGGDPLGTGEGGPGYTFADEFHPDLRHDAVGVLSMANRGPDTNGSQFFITLREVNRLNYLHSVFGRVVRGLDLLGRIEAGDRMQVRIRRIGAAAEAFSADADAFHRHAAVTPRASVPHFDDPDRLLPLDPPRARAFGHKLSNFNRFGGGRIYVRLHETAGPAAADRTPGDLAAEAARHLALPADAVLALYLADRDAWGLWLGPRAPARWRAAAADFLAHAAGRADAALAAAPRERPADAAQRLKVHVDEVVDGLIDLLAPAR